MVTVSGCDNVVVLYLDVIPKWKKGEKCPAKGWDGNYHDKPQPSTDYWYVITLKKEEEKQYVGHFTVINLLLERQRLHQE